MTCVTNFWILIISIHTSRFGNRIKQIWQPLLFINGYLHMEYTLFQDFARKIPSPAPPTGRPGHAQSGRTLEFGYRPLHTVCFIIQYIINIIFLEFPCFVHLPFNYSILQSSDVNSVWRINKFLLASYCYYYHHHYYVCKVHVLLFLVTLGLLALQRYVFVCILFLIQCITLGLQTWKGSVFPLF